MADGDVPVQIRSFRPSDQTACNRLNVDGLISGVVAANDTCVDLDNINGVYMKPGNHFWVAEAEGGAIVGMIGVQHHGDGVGEIRRLRVDPALRRRGIGSALVEAALRFCGERNYLKVTLDTFMEHEPAVRLFEKFRFRHFRTRSVGGKDLMYFLLDLYAGSGGGDAEHKNNPAH